MHYNAAAGKQKSGAAFYCSTASLLFQNFSDVIYQNIGTLVLS